MNHTSSKNPQIQNLKEENVLRWIPSHIGILGNEKVDIQANPYLALDQTYFKTPLSNFKSSINNSNTPRL